MCIDSSIVSIWLEDRTPFVNCIYIIILLLKILLSCFQFFFSFIRIKVLGSEFLIFTYSILFFITKIIFLIYYISTNTLNSEYIFDVLSLFFSVLGTIIYLELIELNFWGLNFDLKKNINLRAQSDIFQIYNIDGDAQSSEENTSDNNIIDSDNII